MKQKSNALIGIFILIFCIIGITMSFIFFNSHKVEGLDISNTVNYSFETKGAKDITAYIPPQVTQIEENQSDNSKDNSQSNEISVDLEDTENIVINENEEIKAILDEYKEEIDPNDLDKGLALSEKLDLEYLLSFDKENLTQEQKQEIKDYLRSNLTNDEYNTVINLLGKYIGLIQ